MANKGGLNTSMTSIPPVPSVSSKPAGTYNSEPIEGVNPKVDIGPGDVSVKVRESVGATPANFSTPFISGIANRRK